MRMARDLGEEEQTVHRDDPARPDGGIGSSRGADPFFVTPWYTARGAVALDRPLVMGVLNLTPDSFWEGSRSTGPDEALDRAAAMLDAGADILDLGGESTRPGAREVPAAEERVRVEPVVAAIVDRFPEALLSIDTVKAGVAAAALDRGAAIVNDVSGLRLDPGLGAVAARYGAGLVLMHSRGTVDRMASYDEAAYGEDPMEQVVTELAAALERARAAGVADDHVVLDPGLGFAKRTEHSVAMLRHLDRLTALGRPVLVGPSRKRFIGELAGELDVEDRLPGTIAACVAALERGARIFRVHDVAAVRRALDVAHAIRRGP